MRQAFIIDVEGLVLSRQDKFLLAHPAVGGVILFARNFENVHQLKALIEDIRAQNSDILITVDQEGGFVQRFTRHGFHALPALNVFGNLYDINPQSALALARYYGRLLAYDMQYIGVDMAFGPVLDLAGNSTVIGLLDRAFHACPNITAELAQAYIQGMHSGGLMSCGKHFPGHGQVQADSHIEMPFYPFDKHTLTTEDLVPFKQLIKEQLLDSIMPAHVLYPAVDKVHSAGFSTIWLKDILRDELGFTGLIISDCLSMTGADIGDLNTRITHAVNAGCDMVIISHQPRRRLKAILNKFANAAQSSTSEAVQAFKHLLLSRQKKAHIPPQHRMMACLEKKYLKPHGINRTTDV